MTWNERLDTYKRCNIIVLWESGLFDTEIETKLDGCVITYAV